jgi:hypothetical protein
VAGLTVPYVKRIQGKIDIPDVVKILHVAARQISESLGATSAQENPDLDEVQETAGELS